MLHAKLTTTTTTKPVPVVRIPRRYSNQVAPGDVYQVANRDPRKSKPMLNSHPEQDEESLVSDEDRQDSHEVTSSPS